MTFLRTSFYLRSDVVQIARDLIGKWVFTEFHGKRTGGMITETEAYAGPWDRASHAFNNRRTERTEVMYSEGGIAYVYFCYGMHYLLNVVTNHRDIPHAVLIRAIDPLEGIETMLERRKKQHLDATLTSGPGSVCRALGIDLNLTGHPLDRCPLWLEDRQTKEGKIKTSRRIGIDYAKEDALLLWRFNLIDRE